MTRIDPEDRDQFLGGLASGDEGLATDVVTRVISRSTEGLRDVVDGLIPSALEEVGLKWESAEWTVAQEHQATAICERIIGTMIDETKPAVEPRRRVLVVCAEGEWHSLSSRAVSLALQLAGWQPVVMGSSVASSQLVAAIFDVGPEFVALSCSLIANLPGARRMILAARETATPIVSGGRAFGSTDDRAKLLGANEWVGAAFDLPGVAAEVESLAGAPGAPHPASEYEVRLVDVSSPQVLAELSTSLGMDHALDGELAGGGVWMLRTLHAALLCDDRRLLTEQIRWHEGRARLNGALPTAVVCRALLGALPDRAIEAKKWLEEAADDAGVEL